MDYGSAAKPMLHRSVLFAGKPAPTELHRSGFAGSDWLSRSIVGAGLPAKGSPAKRLLT